MFQLVPNERDEPIHPACVVTESELTGGIEATYGLHSKKSSSFTRPKIKY